MAEVSRDESDHLGIDAHGPDRQGSKEDRTEQPGAVWVCQRDCILEWTGRRTRPRLGCTHPPCMTRPNHHYPSNEDNKTHHWVELVNVIEVRAL